MADISPNAIDTSRYNIHEVMGYDRGRLSPGLAADIVIFDLNKIRDKATFESPAAVSEGVGWVLVNGVIVFADGKYTGAKPGKVIRGPGYMPNLKN